MGRQVLDGATDDDVAVAASPRLTGLALGIGRAVDALGSALPAGLWNGGELGACATVRSGLSARGPSLGCAP